MWLVGPSAWYIHGPPSVPLGEGTPFCGDPAAMSWRVACNWRGSVGCTGASRWWDATGRGDRSAAAASSARVNQWRHFLICHIRTIESPRGAHNGLEEAYDALQALPDVGILGLDGLLLAQHHLEVMVRLLALEVPDALIQTVDLVLGALSNRALGLAVVRALPGELLGGEVCDATRVWAGAALLVGLTVIMLVAVPRARVWCISIVRRRHADCGLVVR